MTHHAGSHQRYPKTYKLASPFHPSHLHSTQLPSLQLERRLLLKSSLVAKLWMKVSAQRSSNSDPLPPPARTQHTLELQGVEDVDQLEAPGELMPIGRLPVRLQSFPRHPTSFQEPASKSKGPEWPPSTPKLWTPISSKDKSSQAHRGS